MAEQRDTQSFDASIDRLAVSAAMEQTSPQPRVLSLEEVMTVAGGPTILNEL